MGSVDEQWNPSGQAVQRREELVRLAREATETRPDLAALLDRISALEEVALAGHVEQLDAVHTALREALVAAGRDDVPAE